RDSGPMKRNPIPSAADLFFIVTAPIKAVLGAVKLTQSDGDLAAHLRMGDVILRTRHLPAHSLASYTAALDPLVAHEWLSEVWFALLFRAGGLALVAVFTGIVIGLTHAMVAVFLRRRGVDPRWALLAALISLALGASHWLARPHMFTILASALTLFLIESERPRKYLFAIPLFGVWANLHGGWIFGLLLIAVYVAGDYGEAFLSSDKTVWLARAQQNAIVFLAATAGTLLNPYGLSLHREVISAVTSSTLANNIVEYMSPNFHDFTNYPFLLILLLCVALLALSTRRMPIPWLLVTIVTLFFSLRSFRNVSLFGVTAWPLIALHIANGWPADRRDFPLFKDFARLDAQSSIGLWSAPVAALLLILGLNHGALAGVRLISDGFDHKRFPVTAVEKAKSASMPGRAFVPWEWGGYVMFGWPGKPIHVDPLKFSDVTMRSYTTIEELWPGWQEELEKWQVQIVITKPRGALAAALYREPRWSVWYRDSTAVIFQPAPDGRGPGQRTNFR
ncbi:MAG: hypothetical protein ABJB49_10960, partial [Nitrospirota bacterium]